MTSSSRCVGYRFHFSPTKLGLYSNLISPTGIVRLTAPGVLYVTYASRHRYRARASQQSVHCISGDVHMLRPAGSLTAQRVVRIRWSSPARAGAEQGMWQAHLRCEPSRKRQNGSCDALPGRRRGQSTSWPVLFVYAALST
ncbi:hypothetical protein OH77DRAFT_1022700 [Trametes cingulata]|nr:hypothetical protein OH77DRAFT_1022700 [Trametes cingulata]